MYNLAIRKCTSPPLLAPRLKIFKWKFTTPPGIEPRTWWTRGRQEHKIFQFSVPENTFLWNWKTIFLYFKILPGRDIYFCLLILQLHLSITFVVVRCKTFIHLSLPEIEKYECLYWQVKRIEIARTFQLCRRNRFAEPSQIPSPRIRNYEL